MTKVDMIKNLREKYIAIKKVEEEAHEAVVEYVRTLGFSNLYEYVNQRVTTRNTEAERIVSKWMSLVAQSNIAAQMISDFFTEEEMEEMNVEAMKND